MDVPISLIITLGGFVCTIMGAVIGVLTFSRNRSKDTENKAYETAGIKYALDHIAQSVEAIRRDLKDNNEKLDHMREDMIRIDERLGRITVRVDKLERMVFEELVLEDKHNGNKTKGGDNR